MADKDTLALDVAGLLDGSEQVHIVQDGESVRTSAGDIAALAGDPGSVFGPKWEIAFQWTWTTNVTMVDANNLGDYKELIVICKDISTSASVLRLLQLSTNNGVSYFSGATDYTLLANTGTLTNRNNAASHVRTNNGQRTIFMRLPTNIDGAIKVIQSNEGNVIFQASNAKVDAVRLLLSAAGNITGGSMMILGLR